MNAGKNEKLRRFSIELVLVVAVAAMHLPGVAYAQHVGSSAEEVARVRAGVAALGNQWNAHVNSETAKLYTALHRHVDSSGIRRIRDVHYGPSGQQTLDLFVPVQGFTELGPVLVYLHDDTFPDDDKIVADTHSLLYSNVAKWAARVGGVGVNANYRLMPAAKWPSGPDDIRMLIAWVRMHISHYGGNPNIVLVLGNGIGAVHLAGYLFDQASQTKGGPGIAGAILSSGAFKPTQGSYYMSRYLGDGGSDHAPLQLVDSYQGQPVPILLWSAEYDPTESGIEEMKRKLCLKYGKCPIFVRLAGHNHVSHVMSIDSDDTSVTNVIIRFYHSIVGN